MDQDGLTEFSGIGGSVARGAFGPGSLFSGLCLAFALVLCTWFVNQMGAGQAAAPVAQILVALALARFSVNGLAGERRGTIVSMAGGPWTKVATVTLRYLVLSTLWLVPILLLHVQPQQLQGQLAARALGMTTGVEGLGTLVAAAILLVVGMAATPPVFLIVATGAEKFSDIVSPAHWRRLFEGRLGDLGLVYVLYLGGVGTAFVASIPLLILAFTQGVNLGLFVGGVMLVFCSGLAVNLLGRLCGFYAFGEAGGTPIQAPAPDLMAAERRMRGAGPTRPAGARPPVHPPGSPPVSADSGAPPPVVDEAATAHPSGKPPLLDAVRRAEAARQRFAQDPTGAIADLEEMRAGHAPNPQVLHALCLSLYQSGRAEEALAVAREAMPICFERGHVTLAADIFRFAATQLKDLGLERDQLLMIASVLLKGGHPGHAANLYATILRSDASERRAVKGLLQVADLKQRDPAGVSEAVRIYRFLLQHCAASPLADDMRRGLADAESKIARAS